MINVLLPAKYSLGLIPGLLSQTLGSYMVYTTHSYQTGGLAHMIRHSFRPISGNKFLLFDDMPEDCVELIGDQTHVLGSSNVVRSYWQLLGKYICGLSGGRRTGPALYDALGHRFINPLNELVERIHNRSQTDLRVPGEWNPEAPSTLEDLCAYIYSNPSLFSQSTRGDGDIYKILVGWYEGIKRSISMNESCKFDAEYHAPHYCFFDEPCTLTQAKQYLGEDFSGYIVNELQSEGLCMIAAINAPPMEGIRARFARGFLGTRASNTQAIFQDVESADKVAKALAAKMQFDKYLASLQLDVDRAQYIDQTLLHATPVLEFDHNDESLAVAPPAEDESAIDSVMQLLELV